MQLQKKEIISYNITVEDRLYQFVAAKNSSLGEAFAVVDQLREIIRAEINSSMDAEKKKAEEQKANEENPESNL